MNEIGLLQKMKVELADPVRYSLVLNEQCLPMNPMIGHRVKLSFTGKIYCTHCGRQTKKSFSQGYCYPCFRDLAQCDMCIIKPEQCHYDQGTCRDPKWGNEFCMQPHYVYLANSSGIKVGITRHTQIPTRWIDQGAVAALPIIKVSSRHLSGLIEVELKQYVGDKTHWQRMLKGLIAPVDLVAKREEIIQLSTPFLNCLSERLGKHAIEYLPDSKPVHISYPVRHYPSKVKSFNFDKTPEIEGLLDGIKGQYLIFAHGVINLRKFTGYEVRIESSPECVL